MKLKILIAMAVAAVMLLSVPVFAAQTYNFVPTGFTAQTKEDKKEQPARVVTYDEAIEMAIKNTSSLAAIVEAIDYMEKSKESLFSSLESFFPYSGRDMTVETSIGTLLSSVGNIDGNAKSYTYQKQMLEETAELIVKNYFNTIKTSESSLELAKESLELKKQEYEQLVMKNDLGMISDNDLTTAKNELDTMEKNVDMASLAIDSLYSSLAKAIGLKEGTHIELDYSLEYEPLTMTTGIDAYINVKASTDPSVLSAKAAVDAADFQRKISTYETEPYSYLSKKNAVNSADRNYGDTVKNLRLNISNAYNSIMQLESKQDNLNTALNDAQLTYNTAKINYEVGNITELAYKQAELAVKSAENDILSNISNHDMLIFQFNHPYMLGTGGSNQSGE